MNSKVLPVVTTSSITISPRIEEEMGEAVSFHENGVLPWAILWLRLNRVNERPASERMHRGAMDMPVHWDHPMASCMLWL